MLISTCIWANHTQSRHAVLLYFCFTLMLLKHFSRLQVRCKTLALKFGFPFYQCFGNQRDQSSAADVWETAEWRWSLAVFVGNDSGAGTFRQMRRTGGSTVVPHSNLDGGRVLAVHESKWGYSNALGYRKSSFFFFLNRQRKLHVSMQEIRPRATAFDLA